LTAPVKAGMHIAILQALLLCITPGDMPSYISTALRLPAYIAEDTTILVFLLHFKLSIKLLLKGD
tara:strand:- start:279 stop:473 length:195 start_codon:yes stop_codon:yes gene_type:complete